MKQDMCNLPCRDIYLVSKSLHVEWSQNSLRSVYTKRAVNSQQQVTERNTLRQHLPLQSLSPTHTDVGQVLKYCPLPITSLFDAASESAISVM